MTTPTQEKFISLRSALNAHNLERQDEIDIVLTALLAKQHVVLLGPPGTAKSQLAYDIANAFGGDIFKYLIGKYTTPEELFGPMDVPSIKEGVYRRVTRGKLPEADIAFLDEVFKGNTSVLNSLLTIMNEREFDNNGRAPVPLRTLVSASNEMPEGEELVAMFDRFHFRKTVDYLHEPTNFIKLLRGTPEEMPEMTFGDLDTAYGEVAQVNVSDEVLETVFRIRQDLHTEGIIASDRRFRQGIVALRAYAYLNGHESVTDDDFVILQHMLWTAPQEYKPVCRVVLSHTNEINMKADELMDMIDEIGGQVQAALAKASKDDVQANEKLVQQGLEWFSKGKKIVKELNTLEKKAEKQGRPTQRIDQVRNRTKGVLRVVSNRCLGIDNEDQMEG